MCILQGLMARVEVMDAHAWYRLHLTHNFLSTKLWKEGCYGGFLSLDLPKVVSSSAYPYGGTEPGV